MPVQEMKPRQSAPGCIYLQAVLIGNGMHEWPSMLAMARRDKREAYYFESCMHAAFYRDSKSDMLEHPLVTIDPEHVINLL